MIDNNVLLSPTAMRIWSVGGAYAHNLVAGNVVLRTVHGRSTPFHKPHSTEVAGLSNTKGGDDRWYNNLFVGHSGLSACDGAELPVWMEGNVFLSGAKPSKHEKGPVVRPDSNPAVELVEKPGGFYLRITLSEAWRANQSNKMVTTELLGKAKLPGQGYTHADGTPLAIDTDFFGKKRNASNLAAGPFAQSDRGGIELKVWP